MWFEKVLPNMHDSDLNSNFDDSLVGICVVNFEVPSLFTILLVHEVSKVFYGYRVK